MLGHYKAHIISGVGYGPSMKPGHDTTDFAGPGR